MTTTTNAELIAEARKRDREVLGEPGILAQLADALEAVEQRAESAERQVQIRAEDSIAARVARQNVRAVEEWVRVNQERDALAAVVEKVRLCCENQGDKFRYHAGQILDILDASAPADLLREVKAAAWDEGYFRRMDDYPFDPEERDNPYRKEQS